MHDPTWPPPGVYHSLSFPACSHVGCSLTLISSFFSLTIVLSHHANMYMKNFSLAPVFGCHYKLTYKPWYSIFLSQQISHSNQHKRLYEQPNRAGKHIRLHHGQRKQTRWLSIMFPLPLLLGSLSSSSWLTKPATTKRSDRPELLNNLFVL